MESNHRFLVMHKVEDGSPIVIDRHSSVCFAPEGDATRVWADGRLKGFLVSETADVVMDMLSHNPWALVTPKNKKSTN